MWKLIWDKSCSKENKTLGMLIDVVIMEHVTSDAFSKWEH